MQLPRRKCNCQDEIRGSLHCGGKSAAFSRDDAFFVGEGEQATAKARSRSFAARRMTTSLKGKYNCQGGNATAKTKYGGLSTAAARAPPSVEMTHFLLGRENRQRQRREAGPPLREG